VSDSDQRIADLEASVAHQDKVIEELSDVLAQQWKEISSLIDKFRLLRNSIQELEDGIEAPSPGDKPPPHY
jgi:SlyX protein